MGLCVLSHSPEQLAETSSWQNTNLKGLHEVYIHIFKGI